MNVNQAATDFLLALARSLPREVKQNDFDFRAAQKLHSVLESSAFQNRLVDDNLLRREQEEWGTTSFIGPQRQARANSAAGAPAAGAPAAGGARRRKRSSKTRRTSSKTRRR